MTYSYAGFLSYAHADEAVAVRLHKALETYKIPKGHSGTLSPIFRDANELTAHHSLSEKIQDAVEGSRVLIVLCSPAAKASHWVNEEIRLFRKMHGESAVFCVLAEGSPETAFPLALLEGGREPLAANLGATKSSFQLGVTQIAAAMLGVGLDTLIQRDARRKRRRLQAVTAGALLFSGLMGATTFSAVTARKAADTNRQQAEGLVEFMIKDMKEKLEPVGRLDILDDIGQRAVKYYEAQDIAKLSDDSLALQARARHILGQVALESHDFDKARAEMQATARLTREIYDRNPDDTDAIFTHAQSEYWVGSIYYYEKKFQEVAPYWENYADLGKHLYETDTKNLKWISERAWGENNLGLLNLKLENLNLAKSKFLRAADFFDEALTLAPVLAPENSQITMELANVMAGLAQIAVKEDDRNAALALRMKQISLYEQLLEDDPQNYLILFRRTQASARVITDILIDAKSPEFEEMLKQSFLHYEEMIIRNPKNDNWKREYTTYLRELRAMIAANQLSSEYLPEIEKLIIEANSR